MLEFKLGCYKQGSGRDVVYRRRAIAQAERRTGGDSSRKSSPCRLEVEGSKLGESLGHGAELQRLLVGAGRPWRGRSAAEQGAAEQSGGAERRGVAARVGGGASAWDGKLGVRGRFKGERPEISGSGSGRKAAVVSAGDLGRSVGRALKEEGGSVSGPRWSAAGARGAG